MVRHCPNHHLASACGCAWVCLDTDAAHSTPTSTAPAGMNAAPLSRAVTHCGLAACAQWWR